MVDTVKRPKGKSGVALGADIGARRALVLLIGYRAVGKTTIGRLLARQLDVDFVDTDALIVAQAGMSVAELVKSEGWEGFRAREAEVLTTMADRDRCVVATGGGAILHQEAWRVLKTAGTVVWLAADQAVITARLTADQVTASQRPSLTGDGVAEEVARVLAEREPRYRELADLQVDSGVLRPEQAVAEIMDWLEQEVHSAPHFTK